MSTSNSSVLNQSNNAGGDASEKRRGSSNGKNRLAFVEVLRGVYMKKKGEIIHWSDIKKGYKKKTGHQLTAAELNLLCGTKNMARHEIIATKFAPLLTFVDDKFEIVSICPNDCGGTGIHNENEIYCESCVTSGKMATSEIKLSGSSYSSHDENRIPAPRIDSAVSEVSSNFYPNSTMHTAAGLESVDDETNNDGVFQENADAEENLVSPIQSPVEAEKTIRSEYAFSLNESDASVPLLDLMKSCEPWKSDTTQQDSEDDVETTVVLQGSTLDKQESSDDDPKSSEQALELQVNHQDLVGHSEAETIPSDELYGVNRESTDYTTKSIEALELDTTQQDSEDDVEITDVLQELTLDKQESSSDQALELDVNQQDLVGYSDAETIPADELYGVNRESTDDTTKSSEALELDTTQQDSEDDVETTVVLQGSTFDKQESKDDDPKSSEQALELQVNQQDLVGYSDAETIPADELYGVNRESSDDITKSNEALKLDTAQQVSEDETDLDTEVDEKKDLVVEKREVANEVMHRRRKAKCCSVM